MFSDHSLREKIYLGLILIVLIGFLLNNWAAQKTMKECIESNNKLNQQLQDIEDGKIIGKLPNHNDNINFTLPNLSYKYTNTTN